MDAFTRRDLETLARRRSPWCVSCYLPTERNGNGLLQMSIRLKNMTATAEEELVDRGLRTPEAQELLMPVRELAANAPFMKAIADGLAIFVDRSGLQAYRLPIRFNELLILGRRFHVKPLAPLTTAEGRFLLLAVSAKVVRMFEGNRWQIKELHLPGVPANMADALHFDEPQELRQAHTSSFGGQGPTQLGFHGQGGAPDAAKTEQIEFFRYLDRGLRPHLADEQSPLVFAGVEYLFPLFKKTTSYKHVVERSVLGNTDGWPHVQLHGAAWAILEPMFTRQRQEAINRCHRVAGTDFGLLQMEMVLQAAQQGQVDTLVVDPTETMWGVFDSDSGVIHLDHEPQPGNEDLLDLAVCLTLCGSGRVYPADKRELPDRSPVAAVLRYPSTATPIPRVAELAR